MDRQVRKQIRSQLYSKNPALLAAELSDQRDILEYRLALAKGDKGEVGPPGRKGDKGDSIVGPRGPQGEKGETGKDGYTPRVGIDYLREPKDGKDGRDGRDGRDGKDADMAEVRDTLKEFDGKITDVDEKLTESIKELDGRVRKIPLTPYQKKKIDFDDMRWHGAGDTVVAGTNITIVTNNSGQKVISATSGGGAFVDNELVAGSGTTFTLANTPIAGSEHIFAERVRLYPISDYTISGAVITTTLSYLAGDLLADYRK